jgi:tetratricopeptide (TPR) repeat protein/DNA-binding CsgD family transcriptional regulator
MRFKIVLPQDIYVSHLESVNGIKLTRREVDIIAYLLSGKSAKTIAACLSIAPKTIETHMRNIMTKVECNSRDGVISFIEKSKKLSLLKEHYFSLLINASFEEYLLEIANRDDFEQRSCVIVYWKNQDYPFSFISYLERHLKLAGIKTLIETRESLVFSKSAVSNVESKKAECVIYAVPREIALQIEKEKDESDFIRKVRETNSLVALFPGEGAQEGLFQKFSSLDSVYNLEKENYYNFSFTVLKRLFPNMALDQIIGEFKNYSASICGTAQTIPKPLPQENSFLLNTSLAVQLNGLSNGLLNFIRLRKKSFFTGCVLSVGVFCFWYLTTFSENKEGKLTHSKAITARTDLSVPTQAILLDRLPLMEKIDKSLKGSHDIQTIALVGIGGAGKTTLARYYARQQNASVSWEINAGSKEDLDGSFEELAEVLSDTKEEKEKLKEVQAITNTAEKEKKIILLVRDQLKHHPDWILIYDNVERFKDIQNYFPYDSNVWGRGKVIITTRDNNIINNSSIADAIQIGELIPEERLDLFTKIMANGNINIAASFHEGQVKRFLNDIPPFPLDVSIAAYYLKATGIPYDKYLEHLKENEKDFSTIQENVLREATSSARTRYSIITLSLKDLVNTRKDFMPLLLCIALLDSQNIPRDLLNSYKGDVVVENFIYNLKKYSFITNEAPASLYSPASFSIHRSTQEVILGYLTKTLSLQKDSHVLRDIFDTFETYIAKAIDKEDCLKLKSLLSHCERFLSHKNLLPDTIKSSVEGELGYIYSYLGNYKKSREIIEGSLKGLDKNGIKDHKRIARILVHLGDVYRDFGDYEKAKNLLEKGLLIYQKYFDQDDIGIALALVNLGNVYRRLGEYEKAKTLLEESLIIYRKHPYAHHSESARALVILANVYRSLAKYEKAKELFNESLTIYKKHLPENHPRIAWSLAHLGNLYRDLGDYTQARDRIEESLTIYKQHFSENHAKVGWVLSLLGDIYRKLGNYEKAKALFEQVLITFKNNFPENDSKVAHALMDLGDVHGSLGEHEKAKNLLEKSLKIYKEHFPKKFDEISLASTYLANIYIQLGNYETALDLLSQSLKILETYFKEDRRKILLTSLYLGKSYKNLGDYEKAKSMFEGCLQICDKAYGKDHIETAHVLMSLEEIYFLEGKKEAAEYNLNRALVIFQKNGHPEATKAMEKLKKLQ